MDLLSRYRGCLLGLACGDALGAPIEFLLPDHFHPVTDFRGGGAFNVQPGQWTDDTSMALCLADSLIACQGFNPRDQMERYLKWYREGYLSSSGVCFDIGSTTQQSLEAFAVTGDPYSGPVSSGTAGNGCLMRLAPVSMFYMRDGQEAAAKAALSARTTHGTELCLDACRYFSWLLVRALKGESKEELLAPARWQGPPLCPEVAEVAAGSFTRKEPPQIRGSGYVIESLEASLWAFHKGTDFADSVRKAANLGYDTDTTAAICGQIAGAHYGESAIPSHWLTQLHWSEGIRAMADRLFDLSQSRPWVN
jgi:ADP-ribosylglycohydrolase